MEHEHREALRRIYQAEELWRTDGHSPQTFQLLHTGGNAVIDHPCWNPSWGTISEHTIDDLGDEGILRVDAVAPNNKRRTFILTASGRREGAAVTEQAMRPVALNARAPSLTEVLEWLREVAAEAPECFERPQLLLDRAVAEALIDSTGRELLATRVLGLVKDGYVRGDMFDSDLANSEQTLTLSANLELTMAAYSASEAAASVNVSIGSVVNIVNSQVAAGDIKTYNTFVEVLDRAYEEIDGLEVDEDTKEEARRLIDRLRGRSAQAVAGVATGAAGVLVAQLLARLVGLG
jgi:hypothetical protein